MREACDKHGEFKKQADGALEFGGYTDLKCIIARQAYRQLKPTKDAIEAKRLEAFKAGNDGEYFKLYREGMHARQVTTTAMTNKTLAYLELDPMVYRKSMVQHSKDQKKAMEIRLKELNATRSVDGPLKEIEKEKCIEVYKEKVKRELESWRKLE